MLLLLALKQILPERFQVAAGVSIDLVVQHVDDRQVDADVHLHVSGDSGPTVDDEMADSAGHCFDAARVYQLESLSWQRLVEIRCSPGIDVAKVPNTLAEGQVMIVVIQGIKKPDDRRTEDFCWEGLAVHFGDLSKSEKRQLGDDSSRKTNVLDEYESDDVPIDAGVRVGYEVACIRPHPFASFATLVVPYGDFAKDPCPA